MYKLAYRSLFRKSSMLRKLLLSILCLICVPSVLIQIVTIQHSTTQFTEAQHTQTLSCLQSVNTSFTEYIDAFDTYSIKIANADDVELPLRKNLAGYDLYKAASKIKEYDSAYPLIKYVGVYYPSTDRLICNGYCYTLADFADLYYPHGADGYQAVTRFFTDTQGTSFFSTDEYADRREAQLLFARSVSVGGGLKDNAKVFFALENSRLQQWCRSFLTQSSGVAIQLTSGEHLLHTGVLTGQLLATQEYSAFAADLGSYIFRLHDEDDTLIYKYQSPDSAFVILAAMPQNMINENLNQYMRQVRTSLILTLLAMLILTAVTAYINYRPIMDLLRRNAPMLDNTAASELELLQSAFFHRDEQISTQDNLIRTFLVSDLLSGDQADPRELARYFPAEEKMYFAISLTDIVLSTSQIAAMIEQANQMFGIELLITTIPRRKESIFVFLSRDIRDFADREEKLSQAVLRTMGAECGFVSGCVVDNIQGVELSYKDAIRNYYQITESLRVPDAYPTQAIQEFGNHIRRNNLDAALTLLEQIRLQLPRYSAMHQKLIGFDMVRTYIHKVAADDINELDYVLSPDNVPMMFTVLRTTIEKRRRAAESVSKDINREMKAQLVAYVNENCLDSDMCLTAAADHLNTSIYTVSRLFKEATGMGFKDYITSRRLQHACHLLKTTSLSVNAIAQECGFERLAYFSNLFKNEYGVAPSVYRANP